MFWNLEKAFLLVMGRFQGQDDGLKYCPLRWLDNKGNRVEKGNL